MTLASKRLIWLSAAAFFSVLLFTTDCCELAADETEQQHSRTRVQWTTSRLVGSPDPPPPFQAERIWPDLTFQSPISFAEAPSLGLHLVLERRGVIKAFASSGDPKDAFVMLDLWSHVQETEQAKIAAARDFVLDPNFESNGFLYIVWSIQPHFVDGGTRISRFAVTKENPHRIDPETRIDLLKYPSGDHIGACLRFGPDGMLYICTGDGAPPFPPDKLKTAQNLKDVRGSVLRIDVRGATKEEPYVIPDDNPFLQHPNARGEIFAFGIRNGFRAAFHPTTERLWVADVGWERCELVHQISKGGNHGWSLFEGPYAVEPDQPSGPGRPILPVIVMERDRAQSITGGMFLPKTSSLVREDPSLTHQYVFGCYMNGTVWAADVSNPENPQLTVAAKTSLRLIDFKLANVNDTPKGHKDLLMVDFGGGGIYRLVPNQQAQTSAFPRLLSQTGLYDDLNTLRPSPGVIAYQPKATMYRGGAKGSRVIGIPGSEPIDRAYPNGTVLANTISREVVTNSGEVKPKKLETQILLLDGLDWKPYTYRWNDEETDASLVEAKGDRIPIRVPDAILGQRTTEHVFASRTQCNTCHHVANQGPMTFNAANLWGERDEELPEWVITSWDELVDRGVVKSGKAVRPNAKLVNAQDRNESLEARARSYLDINCGACHRRNGGATSSLFLGRSIAEAKMGAINELPAQGDFGITDARILTPGSPEKSILFYRLATAGPGKMPKVIGQEPDIEGAKVVWDWIRSMEETKPRALMTPSEISTTERALLFWNQLAETTPEEACRLASSAIKQNRDPAINGLFNRWIEQDQRRVTVGDQPDFDALLKLPGSAIEGQRWYAHASTSQCRKCHHVHKQDALIGPSLAGISKRRTRRQILEHIAEPSREIADQWKTYNVLTIDGLVIAGLKESEAEESLMLKSSDGRVHRIEKDDIESIRIAEQSLMPSGLISAMTPQEVADMLAYLAALP